MNRGVSRKGHHRLGCRFAATLLLAAMTAGIHVSGCATPSDVEKRTGQAPGSGGNDGNGGSGGSGGFVPTPAGCEPEAEDGAVADTCGVFVSSTLGNDNNPGTRKMPLQTLGKGIERALQGKRLIYMCAEVKDDPSPDTPLPFKEAVTIPAGITIYGGLDCTNGWKWVSTKRTILEGPENAIPLTIRAADESVRIVDLDIKAKEATKDETSSIAVLADGGNIAFERCTLEADDATPGTPGEPPDSMPAAKGQEGSTGNDACTAGTVFPNDPPENQCGTLNDPSDNSIGGLGGSGFSLEAGAGQPGFPGSTANPNGGVRDDMQRCGTGKEGLPGSPGDAGRSANAIGKIDSSGYTGVDGENGKRGAPGQGGGGGAGAKGGECPAGSPGNGGASGGSGGAGGCGGAGGKGGGPGGSSIALISIHAKLSFQDVQLIAKSGGKGGSGALGQDGGDGGDPGPGGGGPSALRGCSGGNGGKGGMGGPGGDGSDGHSLGIAYIGTPPPEEAEGVVTIQVGDAIGNGLAEKKHDFTDSSASP